MTTIAEEQGNSHSVYNPLLTDTVAVHNAQNVDDVKEVETSDNKQLQTHDHVPTIQESQMTSCSKETVEVHSLCDDTIEIFDTDAMPTKGPSPVISNPDDISLLTQKISQQKSYSVPLIFHMMAVVVCQLLLRLQTLMINTSIPAVMKQ